MLLVLYALLSPALAVDCEASGHVVLKSEAALSGLQMQLWSSGYWMGREGLEGCVAESQMAALEVLIGEVTEPTVRPEPAVCRALTNDRYTLRTVNWEVSYAFPCGPMRPSSSAAEVVHWVVREVARAALDRDQAQPVERGPCRGAIIYGPPHQRAVRVTAAAQGSLDTTGIRPSSVANARVVWTSVTAYSSGALVAVPSYNGRGSARVTLVLRDSNTVSHDVDNLQRQGGPGVHSVPPFTVFLSLAELSVLAAGTVTAVHISELPSGKTERRSLAGASRREFERALRCALSHSRAGVQSPVLRSPSPG